MNVLYRELTDTVKRNRRLRVLYKVIIIKVTARKYKSSKLHTQEKKEGGGGYHIKNIS